MKTGNLFHRDSAEDLRELIDMPPSILQGKTSEKNPAIFQEILMEIMNRKGNLIGGSEKTGVPRKWRNHSD
ncbi:MAG: hypothetical protein ABR903_00755 [Thermodesulfovibrionales bacterium]|jgi:hypothetical protein